MGVAVCLAACCSAFNKGEYVDLNNVNEGARPMMGIVVRDSPPEHCWVSFIVKRVNNKKHEYKELLVKNSDVSFWHKNNVTPKLCSRRGRRDGSTNLHDTVISPLYKSPD